MSRGPADDKADPLPRIIRGAAEVADTPAVRDWLALLLAGGESAASDASQRSAVTARRPPPRADPTTTP
jgi:hypothetical protein